MQTKARDYWFVHHYEIGGRLGLWQGTCDDGQGLVPKMWSGRFPYQVRVKLVLSKITEVPRHLLDQIGVNPAVGRYDDCLDEDPGAELVRVMLATSSRRENPPA